MNKFFGIGNLTKDVEFSTTSNGINVGKFTIAIKRRFGEEVDFLNIVVWRELANLCNQYLKKGSKVAISGSVNVRTYDASDGTKRYVTEIVADEVEFLTPKQASNIETNTQSNNDLTPIEDDGLPF